MPNRRGQLGAGPTRRRRFGAGTFRRQYRFSVSLFVCLHLTYQAVTYLAVEACSVYLPVVSQVVIGLWKFIDGLKKVQKGRDLFHEQLVAGHAPTRKLRRY